MKNSLSGFVTVCWL